MSSSSLNSTGALLPEGGALFQAQYELDGLPGAVAATGQRASTYRDVTEVQPGVSGRTWGLLGVLVLGLHIAGIEAYLRLPHTPSVVPPKKSEVLIEFIKPEPPPPPPKVEPPPPPPPPQAKVQPPPKAQPKPAPALRTPPAEQNIAADSMTVPENTQAADTPGPAVAEAPQPPAPPAPPPPPKEEPVTEATGYAGYLQNPAPSYPPAAQRQGWEGKVVLKVRVLANGSASSVEVTKSSGRKLLDEAAINAVKGWVFSPSKRGSTPIDGWATVPIEFKLAQ